MKKLFISCPMKGRTEENIRGSMEKMHRIAEAVFDEELEVIESYIPDHAPKTKHDRIWYLGESIKMLADADYFIGIAGYKFDGCALERSIAERYGIKGYTVPLGFIADDVAEDEACVPCEWIPCSEWIPETDDVVLITVFNIDNNKLFVTPAVYQHPFFCTWNALAPEDKVMAWQPLPEPWEGKK